MKYLSYPLQKTALVALVMMVLSVYASAQCPNGNPSGLTAFDQTISFPSGVTSMTVKFPKFNPEEGMVTCMRICITVGGVVDSLSFENTDINNPHDFAANYGRTDFITGPGISGAMISNINKPYSFSLSASDGVAGSGPDFGKVVNDTILGTTVCHTVTTESSLTEFYGPPNDSVSYNYTITGGVNITSSANASIGISTSGFVRLRFEYCTCPASVLPMNLRNFFLTKITGSKVDLNWSGFDEANAAYYYEGEVSLDGRNFVSIGSVPKNNAGSGNYRLAYTANRTGMHYFRIRQVYANGYVRFSEMRYINLESSGFPKFSLFPNPSDGVVGIKFANFVNGRYQITILNALGQTLVAKEIVADNLEKVQLGSLQTKGVYWIRVTDVNSLQSGVQQLLIK